MPKPYGVWIDMWMGMWMGMWLSVCQSGRKRGPARLIGGCLECVGLANANELPAGI